MSELVRRDVRMHAARLAAIALTALVALGRICSAAELHEAEITTIIHDVQLLPGQAAPRPAIVKDAVKKGTAVRTGADSRTELMFSDQTLARMGANTIFSFNEGTRDLNLGSGVMLVHVPKGAGGATIVTAGVTAGITGTTLMFEYHNDAFSKMIVMEGLVSVWLNARPGRIVEVRGGQILMIPPHATSLPEPVSVDLEKLMLTSPLFTDFAPLPSLALIEEVIRGQQGLYAERNEDLTGLDARSVAFPLLPVPGGLAQPVGSIITFLGLPAGLWSQPASWTPAIVPNNNGSKTYSAIINSGMITQDITGEGVTIQQLQMNGGTLQLDNSLTLLTGLQYTGGTIGGGAGIVMSGTSTQSAPMDVQGVFLINGGTYDLTFDSANAFTGNPGTSLFTNNGTLRKTNGADQVTFNMPINNAGTVSLLSGALVFDSGGTNSGTFSAAAGSVINFASNFSMLAGTRFVGPGAISFNEGTVTTLNGDISNSTTIFVNSVATFTDLRLTGDVTLSGNGTINVTGADRILGSGVLLTNNIIQGDTAGGGSIGADQIGIAIQGGGIDANKSTLVLDVDPNSANGLTNKGFLRASNGGILQLNGNGGGGFNNSNGSITALDLSEVRLTNGASITGGQLNTAGSGVIRNLNTASLNSLSNSGLFNGNDGSVTTISGTINNTGRIVLNSTASNTDLSLNGSVTLSGNGAVVLSSHARILGSGTLTNAGNTIQGETSGGTSIGSDQIGIINQAAGIIDANVAGQILSIDPNSADGFLNQGTVRVTNGGILDLSGNGGGGFNNTGSINVGTNGTVQSNGAITSSGTVDVGDGELNLTGAGTFTQTGGTLTLTNGSVSSATTLDFQGGIVTAFGGISASINNAADFRVALGGSGLNVTGNITLLASSNLSFQLGGLTAGSQYSALNVNGTVGLAGNLVLSFANGFQNSVTNADTFTITSATSIGGNFANITSGSTLQTSDGFGSFVVTISGTNITLSGFTLAPATDAIWTGTTGNWNDGTKWTSNPNFPNNGQPNGTELYNATLDNGGTLTLNLPVTIEKFTLTAGTLSGVNTLNVHQLFTWNGGVLSGGVTLNANGGIAMAGGSQLNLNGATLNNAIGLTATDSGDHDFGVSNGAVINNGGTWLAQNNLGLDFGNGGTFNNTGTFTRNTGAGTYSINANLAFNNNGIVNVDSGTLSLVGGGTSTGSFVANAGGTLRFGGVTDTLNAASVTGAGTVAIASGAWNLNAGSTYNVAGTTAMSAGAANFNVDATTNLLNQSGGTLAIATGKIFTITGLFEWSGGRLTGGGTFNANADINMAGGTQLNINGVTLNNPVSQTATDSGFHDFGVSNSAVINNAGTWLAQNNLGLNFGSGGTFNNTGTFTRNTGAGIYQFSSGISFNNTGTVNVNTGTLGLSQGTSSGPINVNGAILSISGSFTQTAEAFHLFSGGALNINSTTSAQTITGTSGIVNNNVGNALTVANGLLFRGTDGTAVLQPTNGGSLALNGVSVNFSAGAINGANFNGGDANAATTDPGGNGGTLTVVANGDLDVNTDLNATTGINGNTPTGTGGTGGKVDLTSNGGHVTISSKIEVSSAAGARNSNVGGGIKLTSNQTGGTAINVTNSGQLLALLNSTASTGGSIIIRANGAGSKINVQGQGAVQATIQADKGLVDIQQTNGGLINIGDATPVLIHGDVVKIAALGSNGNLTIGGGTIDADTMLQLYATDATGKITFVSNVSLSGASSKFIAAGTVRINNGVQVNVTGGAAQVFANSAQYSSANGGDNSTNGMFTGTAAPVTFSALGGQPSLGAPPSPGIPHRR